MWTRPIGAHSMNKWVQIAAQNFLVCRASVADSSRVILTSLLTDLKEAATHAQTVSELAIYRSYGPILLARRTKSYNKNRDRISLPRAPSDESPGSLHPAASSPDRNVWSGTPRPEVVRHHMQNFCYNQTVTCLRMVTEGISNNMVWR